MHTLSSRSKLVAVAVALLALVAIAWHFAGPREPKPDGAVASSASAAAPSAATSGDGGRSAFPRAVHDPVKREEMRTRLLQALAEARREADEENAHPHAPGDPQPASRGNREPNDLKEFGAFVAQAIKEDFIPMARACSRELASRRPDAGGSTRVAFKLLGDKTIGGVVDEAHIDGEKSTLVDDKFETCIRESMYGVYFDPPPFGGEATLNFDVVVKDNGELDETVDDFQNLKDRRGETEAGATGKSD
jgi:hypothetical protein